MMEKEAGVKNEEILVCTGMGFADSLSASAVGKPILLVDNIDGLSADQKTYLKGTSVKDVYIIGGTGVVSNTVGNQLNAYDDDGNYTRVYGDIRYTTYTAVAKNFFLSESGAAVLAYAANYSDGLTGGPITVSIEVPLLLVDSGNYTKVAS